MEANAGTSGDLHQNGQGAFEFGRLRDLHLVDQSRDEVVGILKSVADGRQEFSVCSGRARVAVFDRVEGSVYGFCLRRLANEFVISHSFLL